MLRNVEIKARVEDLPGLRRLVEGIAREGPTQLHQVDTFFHCPEGRLKLRMCRPPSVPPRGRSADSSAELIYYRRADVAGPCESVFVISPTPDPESLKRILGAAYGVLGVVRKQRSLYLVGQTRVHLDRVDDLGTFVELEVVLGEDQSTRDGTAIARDLMTVLDIRERQLVELAYLDLLQRTEA